MIKCYYEISNGGNAVIVTDGITAKVFDGAPSGFFDGVDLYAEDAEEQLRAKYRRLWITGHFPEYSDFYSWNEIDFDDALVEELEDDVLFFDDSERISVEYNSGESRSNPGVAVDYMLAEIDGVELYAEIPADDDSAAARANYDALVAKIVEQAKANSIDPNCLKFFY